MLLVVNDISWDRAYISEVDCCAKTRFYYYYYYYYWPADLIRRW